jgi:hypothetical protein
MEMKKLILVSVTLCLCHLSLAQELNCKVQVITAQLQTADPKIFQTLQKSVFEFMNNRKWTTDSYRSEERIECSMLINVTQELASDKFAAQITITSNRPVFNSSYQTTMFNWVDKDFQFQYAEYQTLEYNENTFVSNLTSVLAYYAYALIGLDYNSFGMKGGNPYFQKAQTIVNNAQVAVEPGWKSYDGIRNRYWLIDNLLTNANLESIHTVLYRYHREGLDNMYENAEGSRKVITECLQLLNKMNEESPNSMIMQLFFLAKSDELVGIYSKAIPTEKATAVQLLVKLDATNAGKYQNILK